ncbi:MBL fold metallo-hydrolase [Nesterenkonia alba]|uniref:MBL fold metallo-hydrolase n=1 Tax=Nesterenkonia alba TaxID=515814 RepID=UPI0003B7B7A3|nr:MBL fold metallo-hydrolase [Nesterenkonia alba]
MELTIIGCSGSFPGPDSPASCYLVTAEQDGRSWKIAVDFGSGALGALQRHIRLEELDAVLLSHLHPDHYMDLCGLHVAVRWCPEGWNRGRIPVYGPSATAERIAVAYGLEPDPGMSPDFDFRTWIPQQPHTIGPFTVTPIGVNHPIEEAYGLRIEAPGADGTTKTLTYSGDTDACPGLVEAARDADLFLCEAAWQDGRDDHLPEGIHLTGARAGQSAAEASARRLMLTHIPVWTSPEIVATKAAERFGAPVELAEPGATYRI